VNESATAAGIAIMKPQTQNTSFFSRAF